MTAIDYIKQAYDITDRMSVSGGAVEQMAALRHALREAYKDLTTPAPDETKEAMDE